jgi:hypothetical protein
MSVLDIFDKLDNLSDKPIQEGSGDDFIKTLGWVMLFAFLLLIAVIGLIWSLGWMGGFSQNFLK